MQPGGANAKKHPVQRVQTHLGANPGKALISTALEPVWKIIFLSHKRSGSGEHIVHINEVIGSSPAATSLERSLSRCFEQIEKDASGGTF